MYLFISRKDRVGENEILIGHKIVITVMGVGDGVVRFNTNLSDCEPFEMRKGQMKKKVCGSVYMIVVRVGTIIARIGIDAPRDLMILKGEDLENLNQGD